jgi:uncharacterized protein (DUF1697 family)
MKFQTDIIGMHCSACGSLIIMTMEEAGFSNINVDIKTGKLVFESNNPDDKQVKSKLENVFKELIKYSFQNFQKLK